MSFRTTTAIALILTSAVPAIADVTPADVWDQVQTSINTDPTISLTIGSIDEAPERIVVSNLAIQSEQDGITFSALSPSLTIQDRGDGTVEMQYAETSPILVSSTEKGDEFEMALDVIQTAVRYIISGDPELMNFAMSGEQIEVKLTDISTRDSSVQIEGGIIFADLAGNSIYTGGEDLKYSGDFTAGSMVTDISIQDRADGSNGVIKSTVTDLRVDAQVEMPAGLAEDEVFVKGGMFKMDSSVGPTEIVIDFDIPDTKFRVDVSLDGSATDVSLSPDGLFYDSSLTNTQLNMMLPDVLPFPIEASLGKFATILKGPVNAGDADDLQLGLTIADLKISDGIWNLFDPGQLLARDPATLDVQLSGRGAIAFDLNVMEEEIASSNGSPGVIENLKIDALTLNAAGVTADGTGAFVFDNKDLKTFPGIPRPEGSAKIEITGANALLDTLIQMGFVAPEEAMGMRMGMAMFTTPGTAEDSLSSEVEVNAQGHVLVNGQRMR
ncbi:MAG: DUF2125 domain-containing protein [Planktomarina sp.]